MLVKTNGRKIDLKLMAIYCDTLRYTAIHCDTLPYIAIQCDTLRYTAIHCDTLRYTVSTIRNTENNKSIKTATTRSFNGNYTSLRTPPHPIYLLFVSAELEIRGTREPFSGGSGRIDMSLSNTAASLHFAPHLSAPPPPTVTHSPPMETSILSH
jgi:hypothetical protein